VQESPKVVEFPYGATLRDVPAQLRKLADKIQAGAHGEVSTVALTLIGDKFEVYVWGDGIVDESASPTAAAMFGAAQLRILKALEEHGREE
jgi:hypothetical protein